MLARTLSPSHSYSFPPIQKRKGKRTSVPPVAAPHRSSSSIVMVIMRKKGFFCSTKQILPTNVLFYFFFRLSQFLLLSFGPSVSAADVSSSAAHFAKIKIFVLLEILRLLVAVATEWDV